MATQQDKILEEAVGLASGITKPPGDIRELSRMFIAKRLEVSTSMETTKQLALNKLTEKLNDDSASWKPSDLLTLVTTLGEQSGLDLSVIIGAMTQPNGKGAAAGNSVNNFNMFVNNGEVSAEGDVPQISRSSYKILDGLVQISEAIIADKVVK